jgi:hypothetical protein
MGGAGEGGWKKEAVGRESTYSGKLQSSAAQPFGVGLQMHLGKMLADGESIVQI